MSKLDTPQKRHARFHDAGTLYHVMSKTADGKFLLAPKPGIRNLCAGVLGRALQNYPSIRLYAYAFMSNHIHLALRGSSVDISGFMGFLKREISRRIGIKYRISGPKWQKRYTSTALPTPESAERCLKYILAQGVKEHLVSHPSHWPGLHCARALSTAVNESGYWFDSTAYKAKKRAQKQNLAPKRVRKSLYYEKMIIQLAPLPHWEGLSKTQIKQRIDELIDELAEEARVRRVDAKKSVLGAKKVIQASIHQRMNPPPPPWWKKRRRQITAWASPLAKATQAYIKLYREFQNDFRRASERLRDNLKEAYLPGAWMPGLYVAPGVP